MMKYSDFKDCMNILGFTRQSHNKYTSCGITCTYSTGTLTIVYESKIYVTSEIGRAFEPIECAMTTTLHAMPITAAINTKNLAQNLSRVRSSNVWAVGFNVRKAGDKVGDLVMQFKNKEGGAGDLYIYYDVPITTYRKLIGGTSVGHNFWVLIRNNFNYSKLTGNKRGILPNAIN